MKWVGLVFAGLLLAALLGLALARRDGTTPRPLLSVPEGFQVELVLKAPEIEAPTALCVAPNGDVYFAEDPMDMAGPPTENRDRVWLLKRGDPKRKVLIADRLWSVMGLELVRNELYVVHSPYLTVFTLDSEGEATRRRDLFKDLGPPRPGPPGLNDHLPSGIRAGMDGFLYVCIGDKGLPAMTRTEEGEGSFHVAGGIERRSGAGRHLSLEGGGVIRFRPDGSGLEVFASGLRNVFDLALDEEDRIFARDNTDDGGGWDERFWQLPEGGFAGYPWAYKRDPDSVLPPIRDFGAGGSAGAFAYADDGLPDSYRGRIFHCDWGRRLVLTATLAPDGAGFRVVGESTFMDALGTKVRGFRPIAIRPTADGRGFYVSDWGSDHWLRPGKAGRIWKVTYIGGDVRCTPRGSDADPVPALVVSLDHPALSERLRAQRALAARGEEAVAPLRAILRRGDRSGRARRHALWALMGLRHSEAVSIAVRQLRDRDASVRLQAARVLGSSSPGERPAIPGVTEALRGAFSEDPDPQVRLYSVAALARSRDPQIARTLLLGLDRERDRWIRHALIRALKRVRPWKALLSLDVELAVRHHPAMLDGLLLALTDEYEPEALALLGRYGEDCDPDIRRRALSILGRVRHDRKPYSGTWWGYHPGTLGPPPRDVAWEGTAFVREVLLTALADVDVGVRHAAVSSLQGPEDPVVIRRLTDRFGDESDDEVRSEILKRLRDFRTPRTSSFFKAVLLDPKLADPPRLLAIEGLETGDPGTAAELLPGVARGAGPVALRVRALESLGRSGGPQALAASEACLRSAEAPVRCAAVRSLAKLGDAQGIARLVPLLNDAVEDVRLTTIGALGDLKSRKAIPALLKAAREPNSLPEAVKALAKMPDPRALGVYLSGLEASESEVQAAAGRAIAAIREEVAPELDRLAGRGEIHPIPLGRLWAIYGSERPVTDWRLDRPLPGPGEAGASPGGDDLQIHGHPHLIDMADHGKVLLPYAPNGDRAVVSASAEVRSRSARKARLVVGNDVAIVVRLNGETVYEAAGNRAWASNSDQVNVRLVEGINRLEVDCFLARGRAGAFSLAVSPEPGRYAFLEGGTRKNDLEAFRSFARRHSGDLARGRRLFEDPRRPGCVACHSIEGRGGRVGPDLGAVGRKLDREALIDSVLEPSRAIAQGYETILVATSDGRLLSGLFGGESADSITLVDREGERRRIALRDVESRSLSPASMMPDGLVEALSPEEFADLIAFLESCRSEKRS